MDLLVGDWVAYGDMYGKVMRVTTGGRVKLQLYQAEQNSSWQNCIWRQVAELKPIQGRSGVPKQSPAIGDWVGVALGGMSHTMGFVIAIEPCGRLCVHLPDKGTCIFRRWEQVKPPFSDAPHVHIQQPAVPSAIPPPEVTAEDQPAAAQRQETPAGTSSAPVTLAQPLTVDITDEPSEEAPSAAAALSPLPLLPLSPAESPKTPGGGSCSSRAASITSRRLQRANSRSERRTPGSGAIALPTSAERTPKSR